MIQFPCGHCGVRLKVPETHAGKNGRCPKCKAPIRIPRLPTMEPTETERASPATVSCGNPPGNELLGLPHTPDPPTRPVTKIDDAVASDKDDSPPASHTLLYPLNVSGIIHVLIFSLLPPLWARAATVQFWESVSMGELFCLVLLTLYFIHYAAACLSDSASGGTRAADINSDSTPLSVDALASTFQTIFPVVALTWGPPFAYYLIEGQADWALIAWLAVAGFLFPITILSVNYFDSVRGANPLLVLPSIVSVFVPYCVLVAALFALGAVAGLLMYLSVGAHGICALRPAMIYILLVQIHLLGRFYGRYEDRLAWDI